MPGFLAVARPGPVPRFSCSRPPRRCSTSPTRRCALVVKSSLANPGWETGLTSAAIIVAQFATILMALLVTRANVLGRKPLLLLAFVRFRCARPLHMV